MRLGVLRKKKKKTRKTHTHKQQCGDCRKGLREIEEGIKEINTDEHIIQ